VHALLRWGNLRERDLLARPRRRWEGSIKMLKVKLYKPGQALRFTMRLRLLEFLDSWHLNVVSCQPYAPAAFSYSGKISDTHFC
jgi:hypothetical protein